MAFLSIDELKTVAPVSVVNLITNADDETVNEIILESIDIMKSYLFKYYDADAVFATEGNARSKVVLKYLKDIVIYEIYKIRSTTMNEVAKIDYDEAILWLDKIASGDIDVDLPGNEDEETPSTFLKLGSRKTYDNHF